MSHSDLDIDQRNQESYQITWDDLEQLEILNEDKMHADIKRNREARRGY